MIVYHIRTTGQVIPLEMSHRPTHEHVVSLIHGANRTGVVHGLNVSLKLDGAKPKPWVLWLGDSPPGTPVNPFASLLLSYDYLLRDVPTAAKRSCAWGDAVLYLNANDRQDELELDEA